MILPFFLIRPLYAKINIFLFSTFIFFAFKWHHKFRIDISTPNKRKIKNENFKGLSFNNRTKTLTNRPLQLFNLKYIYIYIYIYNRAKHCVYGYYIYIYIYICNYRPPWKTINIFLFAFIQSQWPNPYSFGVSKILNIMTLFTYEIIFN